MRSHHRTPTSSASHTSRLLLAIVIVVAFWSPPALPCGNVNCTGGVDLSDLSSALSYMSGGSFVMCNYPASDMDNHFLFTWMDVAMILDIANLHPNSGVCPPALGPLNPPISPNDYLYYDQAIYPANVSQIAVNLGLFVSDTIDMAILPTQFLIGGSVPTIDSIKTVTPFTTIVGNHPAGSILVGRSAGATAIPSITYPNWVNPLATVYLSFPPSGVDRSITLSFIAVGPIQDTFHVTTPLLSTPWPTRIPRTPSIRQSCCFGTTGNVNTIGSVDLADLSLLVSFLTGGTSSLPCPEEANTNGIGAVDLSDLSLMVAVLTGGPEKFTSCR